MRLFHRNDSQYGHQSPPKKTQRIAVIDTETTGLYNSDRIVEVGIVVLDPSTGEIVDEFESLVNPGRDVGPTSIHGITASMVTTAPHFEEIASDIAERIDGCVLSAHNLPFDSRMLGLEFSRAGALFEPGKGLCTLRMFQMRLDLACEEYGIKRDTAHRALDDARAASRLLVIYLNSDVNGSLSAGCEPAEISLPSISLTSHGVCVTRDDVPGAGELPRLQREHRLELSCDDPALLPYLDLLGMALDDLVLTEEEMWELKEEAGRLGLDSNQIALAHELAYKSLASDVGKGDLFIEKQLLDILAPRLGISDEPAFIDQRVPVMIPTVCFTGDAFIKGQFVEREELEDLALAAGWSVEPAVTKSRCTLLVGDRNSQSIKARQARKFGIEIATGDQFAALIGLSSSIPNGPMVHQARSTATGSSKMRPSSRQSTEVTIEVALPVEMRERLALAADQLARLKGSTCDDDEWDKACDEWEAGKFRGDAGLKRLHHILEVFLAYEDEQAPEVALRIADYLRDDAKHGHEETMEAYANAFTIAQTFPFDEDEERRCAVEDVISGWAEYLAEQQDIDHLVGLVETIGSDKELIGSIGARDLVHRMRTSGKIDAAVDAAEKLSARMASAGAILEAADICAEWAQALADSGRSSEAMEVCDRARTFGWESRDLANRYSLILERAKNWEQALEVCNKGLELAPEDEQLYKRRDRCLKHLTSES